MRDTLLLIESCKRFEYLQKRKKKKKSTWVEKVEKKNVTMLPPTLFLCCLLPVLDILKAWM